MNISGVSQGLLNFCLSHSDGPSEEKPSTQRPLSPGSAAFLRKALESMEDPAQVMLRTIALLRGDPVPPRATDEDDEGEADKNKAPPSKAQLLAELAENVENVDHAVNLRPMNGWPVLVSCLNDADPEVRTNALWCVGAACQNTEAVALEAEAAGCLHLAVAQLTDDDDAVAKKAMYACSSMVRASSGLMSQFVGLGGATKIAALTARDSTKVKALHLLRHIVEAGHLDLVKEVVGQAVVDGLRGGEEGAAMPLARASGLLKDETVISALRQRIEELKQDPDRVQDAKDLEGHFVN
jgi:hypothetical protein